MLSCVRSRAARTSSAALRLVTPLSSSSSDAGEEEEPKSGTRENDLGIVAKVRRGECSAVAVLHDRVRPQIDRTLERLLGRRDADHEELAQIALTELVLTIHRFRGDCSLDHWTARITAHAVYNEMRRRRRARRVFAFEIDTDLEESMSRTDTEREVGARGLLRRVRACLDELEPNKAWTLVLHDVCGHSLREVADITSVSLSAAQSRLVRARREFRALMACDPELADLCGDVDKP